MAIKSDWPEEDSDTRISRQQNAEEVSITLLIHRKEKKKRFIMQEQIGNFSREMETTILVLKKRTSEI